MAFFRHVGPRPSKKHSLDRLDNSKGYIPGNLAWRLSKEQNNNRRPHRPRGTKKKPPKSDRVTCTTHGKSHDPKYALEYKSWGAMKSRCLNPNYHGYSRYGGRGITIYEPWINDFQAFYDYIGPRPTASHSLDRINNDGNYEPGNVRWATPLQQTQNRKPCVTGPEHANSKHNRTKTPEYSTWGSIKTRCYNPKHDGYARYGALGICMCRRWRDSFEAFLEDLGPKPPKHTILREDVTGHYSCGKCPECRENGWVLNCRWASSAEQNQNRRPSERSGKLDWGKVREIRARLEAGQTRLEVARAFGVGASLVGKIGRQEVWKDMKLP